MVKDFLNRLSETWCLKYVLSFPVKCPVFNRCTLAVALEFEEKASISDAFGNKSCLVYKLIPDALLNDLISECLTLVNVSANFNENS